MTDPNKSKHGPVKPNLKHDTMEYAASADGDDLLDSDLGKFDVIDEEEITAEELELLQGDDWVDLAAALDSAETDSLSDEDNFLNEEEETNELEEEDDDDENTTERNK